MGVIADLIDGVVRLSESTAEFGAERLRSLTLLGGLVVVAVFLLLVFLIDSMAGLLLSGALGIAGIYLYRDSDGVV